MTTSQPGRLHQWRFFRSGGFDQVRIETADDLRHLEQLDQKLWSVLACPTSGLEFDTRTLQLLDQDKDGSIRAPEVLAAVQWVCKHLHDPQILFDGQAGLPLAGIATHEAEGAQLLATAQQVLAYLGKPDAEQIFVEDLSDTTALFEPHHFNGDGVVPPELATDLQLADAIRDIMALVGGETDRSGVAGIDQARLDEFYVQAEAQAAWFGQAQADPQRILPLAAETAAAAEVVEGLRHKIDDFFTRSRLAAFDERATQALNPSDTTYAELAVQALASDAESVAALPLALVSKAQSLPLRDGVNPAWAAAVARLRDEVVRPLLGERDQLSFAEWQDLAARFAAYRDWQAAKPQHAAAALDEARLIALLNPQLRAALYDLIAQDLAASTAAEQIEALEKLVRYRRDLVTLLRNFVSLTEFYSQRDKAIFQAGRLYLDQRSCELCLRVVDMDRHAALAPLSGTYLVYCQCERQGEAPMTIVAAMTGGDVDDMMVPGRNGVFYDRQGRDWRASVVKVVENPISVRQAFWSPYRRIGRMISEQVQKFAASRDQAVSDKAASGIADAGAQAEAAAPAAPAQPFDIARFAGIFAAIGLALGALGTAVAAVVTGFLGLPLWQMPLVILGIILLISGPSMLIAWFKLRARNLGPLLDANGWAVNTRARINIPFGAALTKVATLPAGASRSLSDPYADKKSWWPFWLIVLIVIGAVGFLWQQGMLDGMLAQLRGEPAVEAPAEAAAATPEAAPDQ